MLARHVLCATMSLTSGALHPGIRAVLDFWFGDLLDGFPAEPRNKRWFLGHDDALLASRFGSAVEAALLGQYDDWAQTPSGRLVLILMLDQFTRSLYRGTTKAFSGDTQAMVLCRDGLDSGVNHLLEPVQQLFFYMPLQHSEALQDQLLSVRLVEKMLAACLPQHRDRLQNSLGYAVQHHNIVEQFGRFPHRNDILGRQSSTAELRWLADNSERFGQTAPDD